MPTLFAVKAENYILISYLSRKNGHLFRRSSNTSEKQMTILFAVKDKTLYNQFQINSKIKERPFILEVK